jgi:hypothetical protein
MGFHIRNDASERRSCQRREIVGIEARLHCDASEQPMCHDACGTIAMVW